MVGRLLKNVCVITKRNFSGFGVIKLGPPEVTHILRQNEKCIDVNEDSVAFCDLNLLPSNDPIEDRLIIARNRLTTGATFGVFDGHGGSRMAQAISQRLPHYLALSVLPSKLLQSYVETTQKPVLVERVYSVDNLNEWQYQYHMKSLQKYAEEILNQPARLTTKELLEKCFQFLDDEVSNEILETKSEEALTLAVQGCVGCVAHITGQHLYVASTGDCRAVLGIRDDRGAWTARALNKEHDTNNVEELHRVLGEHPKEQNTVIRGERLLGSLAPLRAFGDYTFKWTADEIKQNLVPLYGPRALHQNYLTPPYLTAKPEVMYHILSPRDKFLVIASDGLWEMVGSQKVVNYVAQYIQGITTQDLYRLPKKNMMLGEIQAQLNERRRALTQKPQDTNAATHLLRNALGRTEYGVEHSKLAAYLGLPSKMSRNYRDDMSILVVFFNEDYLKKIK